MGAIVQWGMVEGTDWSLEAQQKLMFYKSLQLSFRRLWSSTSVHTICAVYYFLPLAAEWLGWQSRAEMRRAYREREGHQRALGVEAPQ